MQITSEGRPHLGAPIGTQEYFDSYVQSKVQHWASELKSLVNIASTQPHSAYSAFTNGLTSRWTYLVRTIPRISLLLQPLETIIRTELLPTLSGRAPPGDLERDIPPDSVEFVSSTPLSPQIGNTPTRSSYPSL